MDYYNSKEERNRAVDKELLENGTSDRIRAMEERLQTQWREANANRTREPIEPEVRGGLREVTPWREEIGMLAGELLKFSPKERISYLYKNYFVEAGEDNLKKLINEVKKQDHERSSEKSDLMKEAREVMKLSTSKRNEYYAKVKQERGEMVSAVLVSEVRKQKQISQGMER